jgi:hypothetical protein
MYQGSLICTLYTDKMHRNAHTIQIECRLNAYFDCTRIRYLAQAHLLVVGSKRPAVDKLLAKEVPDVEAAEDFNLKSI